MGVVAISVFGGELPAISSRALPAEAARSARNLMAGTDEFRPVSTDLDVAVASVANPKTLYRMARLAGGAFNTNMTTGWISHAGEVNYVKGQLNDDTTERTYYTIPDGAPRARDAAGNDRQLGVPRPSVKPGVSVLVGYTYTAEEEESDTIGIAKAMRDAVIAASTPQWTGVAVSAAGVDDTYLRAGSESSLAARTYGLTGGVVTDAFSTVPAAKFAWVFDAALGGYTQSGRYVIPYFARAKTYALNSAALKASLEAIKRPLSNPPENVISTAQAAEIVAFAEQVFLLGGDIDPMMDAHKKSRDDVELMLAGGADENLVASVRAFYNKTSTKAAIDAAIATFASAVFNAANAAAAPLSYTSPEVAGGGGD